LVEDKPKITRKVKTKKKLKKRSVVEKSQDKEPMGSREASERLSRLEKVFFFCKFDV